MSAAGEPQSEQPPGLACVGRPTATLEDLSREFGVSRERIRQIEIRAFEKVQKAVKNAAQKALAPKTAVIAEARV